MTLIMPTPKIGEGRSQEAKEAFLPSLRDLATEFSHSWARDGLWGEESFVVYIAVTEHISSYF